MNIRLYNAKILTMEEDRPVFDGEIWIKNERIAYIADSSTLCRACNETSIPPIHWDREIDCDGNLLMPGFKNAHTHSAMTFLRSYADDVPLSKWLNEKIFPMEAKLTEEDIYTFVKLAVLEYLTAGITSVFDMYINPKAVARACMDMGMRCVLVPGLNNFTSSPALVEEEYEQMNKVSPLISYQLGFHAEYTCSKELLDEVARLAYKYKAPVYTHMSETENEVKECIERYQMTPLQFLDSLGIFDYGGGGYHCVYITEEEMEILSKRGMYVITNPASNLKLASGIAPIAEYMKRDIPVAIGTDGPASNNCLDMFREMFLVSGLSKILTKDAASMDAVEVLKMATVNGARSMQLRDADVLAKGKLADIIMIDLQNPNMQPIHNIPKNLVYSGSKSNVLMTMINGKILYHTGDFFVGESPLEIYRKCAAIIRRMQAE